MNNLSKHDVIKIVQKQCRDHDITAYQIAKNTDLSIRGIQKILDGSSKNPRDYTLDMIFKYIEDYLSPKVEEPESVYKTAKWCSVL